MEITKIKNSVEYCAGTVRCVSSCKECSRCNTSLCRLVILKRYTIENMNKYWSKL